jgi:hypothetical protein
MWLPVRVTTLLVSASLLAAACTSTPRPTARGTTPSASASASPTAAATRSPSAPTTHNPVPPVAGKTMLGSYLSLSGLSQPQASSLRRGQLGRDLRIMHIYYAWEDRLPRSFSGLPAGGIPLVSWRGTYYQTITSGSADAMIAANARELAAYRKPVLLRWAWEMNGSWYQWSGVRNDSRTAGFIAAWRRIHDIFRANGATNVAWVWGPNYYSKPVEPWNDLTQYYPGDAYVDWVAASGYGTGSLLPENLFGAVYQKYADRKPIMIAETSVLESGGTIKADWIDALASWITAHPALGALVWFDTDTDYGNKNWRTDSSAGAVAAFRRLANDPRFSG